MTETSTSEPIGPINNTSEQLSPDTIFGILLAGATAEHYLNNQLGLILGHAAMLDESSHLPTFDREHITGINQAANNIRAVVTALSKIQQPIEIISQPPIPPYINLNDTIARVQSPAT